ncbi:hypothetical protein GCM10027605_67610 [Micromonospora zhanjiangensis]
MPGPVVFALLLVLALHHYNLTARLEKRERTPLLRSFGLGWDGRMVLLTAAVVSGVRVVPTVTFVALAGYLFTISVLSAVTGWVAAARALRTPTGAREADDRLVNERQRAG